MYLQIIGGSIYTQDFALKPFSCVIRRGSSVGSDFSGDLWTSLNVNLQCGCFGLTAHENQCWCNYGNVYSLGGMNEVHLF